MQRQKQQLETTRLTLADRLVSAALGALFGAIIGAVLVWLFGVYSQNLGSARTVIDGKLWILVSTAGFAFAGLLVGPNLGSFVGTVFDALYQFENTSEERQPGWVVAAILIVLAIAGWWWHKS
jgi:hypothetical protein